MKLSRVDLALIVIVCVVKLSRMGIITFSDYHNVPMSPKLGFYESKEDSMTYINTNSR